MATNGLRSTYACHCLNVQITHEPTPDNAPPADNAFASVHCGDNGIAITHVQATLRNRSSMVPDPHGQVPRSTRFISLTCLVCQTLVYRAKQVLYAAADGGEGPVLPGDNWAEQDVLMSASGWVEVSKNCLLPASFSKVFGIVVPSGDPNRSFPTPSSVSPPSNMSETPWRHLPSLPPLFAPPPFTPSHPVFQHFKSLATREAERAQEAAEAHLAKIAQDQAAELQAFEVELRREVEVLWSRFKDGIDKLQQEPSSSGRPTSSMARRRSSQKAAGTSHGNGVTDDPSASVRINDFVPAHSVPARMTSPTSPHQVTSALSASLATSSFHYPGDRGSATRNEGISSRSPPSSAAASSPGRSSMTRVVSPSTASSRTVAMGAFDAEGSIRDAYRRNMDESKDIATSYRYVLDLEAQMAERQRASSSTQEAGPSSAGTTDTISPTVVPRGRSPRGTKSSIKKGKEKENARPVTPTKDQESETAAESGAPTKEVTPKGKRKVTFDVKPEITIIDSETADGEREKDAAEEAAIFDMEGEDNPEQPSLPPSPTVLTNGKSTTTPPPQVTSPSRRRRPRLQDAYGLPSSLSSLRPSSLPNIQSMRPPITRRVESDRPRSQAKEQVGKADRVHTNGDKAEDEPPLSPDSREAHILNLVAASVPSHRSAWKKDSKAWQVFVERQGRRSKELGPVSIEEEEESDSTVHHDSARLGRYLDEFDDYDDEPFNGHTMSREDRSLTERNTIASSLPIPIMRNLPSAPLQPKTSLTDRPGLLVPVLRTSSSAVRRQVYAERDRNRQIDPGAFELDDVADDEEEDDTRPNPPVGSLAEKRALQILEAADGVPSEGMWRSLAA
ncbi:uncharacterized protein B0H18DRAFT_966708 [Fomitopsis serialis]|uniref:uncharacterized protein n=1 Tax=Fomitopsis serialis TaxID=139415 RepID=UPI002008814D|nr:uncharacterized protein B0H18DRAFT_966708 [Neoantrodia serialis]KAH9938335.1 hypothetical protein B0H18DRAFT_966708 [Neoantrodia serialis]